MHRRYRFLLLPVAICLALAVAPAFAAKPAPTPISPPEGTPLEHPIGGVNALPPVCQLGVLGPPALAFGYIEPPDDGYYTLLNPVNCPTCPNGYPYKLTVAHMQLSFTESCNIPVTVSIVPAFEITPGCLAPNVSAPPICGPNTYTINDGGTTFQCVDYAFPMPDGCCITGPVFLVFEFDQGSCRDFRPGFCSPASCNNCTQYNYYGNPPPGDDLCAVLRPSGIYGAIMYADAECCPPPVGVGDAPPVLATGLQGVAPNPSAGRVRIQFALSEPGAVGFEVLDMAGRVVARIPGRRWEAGTWSVGWDGRSTRGTLVAAGIYFVQMRVDERRVGLGRLALIR